VVSLGLGAQQEMRVALTVGDVQQIFRVSRAAPIVEATNPTVSNWVVTDEIVELVLNGRDWVFNHVSTRLRLPSNLLRGNALTLGLGPAAQHRRQSPTESPYRLNGLIINDYSNAGPGSV
jgi:hypothetical protein